MKKQEIVNNLQGVFEDANHIRRRCFRAFIDGSYTGYEDYKRNCQQVLEDYSNDKRLRAMAISQWSACLAQDFDCSISTASRATIEALGDDLEALNIELIDELRDLVRDQEEV